MVKWKGEVVSDTDGGMVGRLDIRCCLVNQMDPSLAKL